MSSFTLNEHQATNPQGNYKAIILLHGGALSHRMYKDVIPHLTSHDFTVFTSDLPGHGSNVSYGPFTFKRSTELLQSAINDIHANLDPEISAKAQFLVVGVSLGGQAVLDLISHASTRKSIKGVVVASAPVRPPDDLVQWEMPHMPADEEWIKIMTEDVNTMGMENAGAIQKESFGFQLNLPSSIPPMLVVVGENDVAMAKRDFEYLTKIARAANSKSEGMVLKNAWHNHPIDIPERFAKVIVDWAEKVFE